MDYIITFHKKQYTVIVLGNIKSNTKIKYY